jgi:hypothetical protein
MVLSNIDIENFLHSIKLNGVENAQISISTMPVLRLLYLNLCHANKQVRNVDVRSNSVGRG